MPRPASLDWTGAQRTGGRQSAAQKRELPRSLVPTVLCFPAFRLRMAAGRRGTARLDLDTLVWPDSALVHDAEAHAREVLDPWVLEQSYRTWTFGLLLAQLDGTPVDESWPSSRRSSTISPSIARRQVAASRWPAPSRRALGRWIAGRRQTARRRSALRSQDHHPGCCGRAGRPCRPGLRRRLHRHHGLGPGADGRDLGRSAAPPPSRS